MTEYKSVIPNDQKRGKHDIYIFTFIAKGKQRYYVGETADSVESRVRSHFRYVGKSILHNGKIVSVPPDEIYPVSLHIIDSARSRRRARYKERMAYMTLANEVQDKEMVCGGF